MMFSISRNLYNDLLSDNLFYLLFIDVFSYFDHQYFLFLSSGRNLIFKVISDDCSNVTLQEVPETSQLYISLLNHYYI